MPEDVLQHDDRVVHQEPYAEGESAERHDVEAHVERVAEGERRHHRDRDREADRERISRVAQKEEEHEEGEHTAEEQRGHDVRDRVADERGLAGGDLDRDFRELLAQLPQRLPHRVRDANRVRPRLLEHLESDRGRSVEAGDRLQVGDRIHDRRDIGEDHLTRRRSLGPGDHDLEEFVHLSELAQRAEAVLEAPAADRPARRVVVRLIERVRDVVDRHLVDIEVCGVDDDPQFALRPAREPRQRHPVELLQASLEDDLGQVAQAAQIGPAHRERHDRIARRVRSQDRRPLRPVRELLRQVVQTLARVEGRELHVRAPPELELDERLTLARPRRDAPRPRHGVQLLLDRLRDPALDLGGSRVRVRRPHRERREGDVRKEVDREAEEGHHADHGDAHVEHRGGHGPTERQVG